MSSKIARVVSAIGGAAGQQKAATALALADRVLFSTGMGRALYSRILTPGGMEVPTQISTIEAYTLHADISRNA